METDTTRGHKKKKSLRILIGVNLRKAREAQGRESINSNNSNQISLDTSNFLGQLPIQPTAQPLAEKYPRYQGGMQMADRTFLSATSTSYDISS